MSILRDVKLSYKLFHHRGVVLLVGHKNTNNSVVDPVRTLHKKTKLILTALHQNLTLFNG